MESRQADRPISNWGPVALGLFSLANYGCLYLLNLVLARSISLEEFNDYNVGVATLMLLAAIAPLGLEKYALKVVPSLTHHEDWPRLRGFLRFAVGTAVVVSVVLSLSFDTVLESILLLRHSGYHIAIPMIVSCLPLMTVFFLYLEIATAYGAPIIAAAIYRLALPLLLLLFNLVVLLSPLTLSGFSAAWCFALAWTVALLATWILVRRLTPKMVHQSRPVSFQGAWLKESIPLLFNGLLMTVFAQSGIIILKFDPKFHIHASVFAVAMQTGAFVVLFTTSTNRYYLPRVSLLIESNDRAGLLRLRRQRQLLMGTLAFITFLVVVLFGRPLLRLFGTEFEKGYSAACVIAVGASVSTVYALSPISLQFAGYHRLVIRSTGIAALCSVGLCVLLTGWYGSLGAAIAYAVPLSSLYIFLAGVGMRLLREKGTTLAK